MKTHNRIYKSTILSLLLLASPFSLVSKEKQNSWWETGKNVGIAGLIAGGIAGGVGLAIMAADAVSNWINPSNKTILDEGQLCIGQRFIYTDAASHIKIAYHIPHQSLSDCGWICSQLNEMVLYDIGISLWNEGKNLPNYVYNLKKYVQDLHYHYDRLKKRIVQIKHENATDYQTKSDLHNMKILSGDIGLWIDELSALHNYLNHHISYFELAQKEWDLCKEYDKELQCIRQGGYPHDLYANIVYFVRSYYPNELYPSISYIKRLEKHNAQIAYARKQAAYYYTERFSWVDLLIRDLNRIRQLLDSWYRDELVLYEKDRLAREHIHLLKEQARVIEDQARALERSNHIRTQELLLNTYKTPCIDELKITVTI